ncbi:hypothetical protein EI94DRAFT_1818007 [Lactarius quietus]|nr:hypothetical protein EI94DRAFT_1818007 [Lactarius quietus]
MGDAAGPGNTIPPSRFAQSPLFRRRKLEERFKIEVQLDDFIDTFVPNLPENLETSLVLQHVLNLGTWKELSSSSNKTDLFKELFDGMVNAAQFIWAEMSRCPVQRWSFVADPGAIPNVSKWNSTIKTDTFFYSTAKKYSDSQSYSYYHVALAAEFKKAVYSLDVSPDP